MRSIYLSLLVPFTVAACASALPPKELVEARSQYQQIAQGPAAAETPAELHSAKTALDQAEKGFEKDGDEPQVRDAAYVALRKAQLADAAARFKVAQKAKAQADVDAQKAVSQNLSNTQAALSSSQQNLAKTQEQLDAEKRAREDAEKRAAQALADLQKIASVKQETRGMVITLSGSVLFATDKSTLLPAANTKLNEVADALIKGNKDANIVIEGHTDSQGARDHNMELAQARADSVKTQLVSRGVAGDRIKTVGIGPERPIADNKSPEGRANNRRVEIIVEPMGNTIQGPSSTQSNTPSPTKK